MQPHAAAAGRDSASTAGLEPQPATIRQWRRRIIELTDLLAAQYGSPRLGNVMEPTTELFYVLLSNRSDRHRCAKAFAQLKARYRPWNRLLSATVGGVQGVLRPLGMDRVRAERMLAIAARLQADFGAVSLQPLRTWPMPDALRYLTALPGVGEKSARCVLMYSLGHDVSPVDAHQLRILVRTGLLAEGTTVQAAHRVLDRWLPEGYGRRLHVNLVAHGRAVCTARRPNCAGCMLLRRCPTGRRLAH